MYDIHKFDGNNIALWKEQMQDVLVQKKQRLPIMQATRTENLGMTHIEWDELDAMAKSTIRLYLAESIYFTILECAKTYATWHKLINTYEC